MTDRQAIFDSAKKFAVQFPGLIQAIEMFEQVSSIDGAFAEAKARLDSAKADLVQVLADIEANKAASAQLVADAQALAASTTAAAEEHIRNRLAASDAQVEQARAHAADIAAQARVDADRIVADANNAIAAAKARMADLSGQIADKTAELERVTADCKQASETLDGINAHIAAVKAKF